MQIIPVWWNRKPQMYNSLEDINKPVLYIICKCIIVLLYI